jgi:hypothetical protein
VRRLAILALALAFGLPASVNAAGSSMRAGVFSGYAFDACRAPAVSSLQAWSASPYRAVGIYIGGVNRACKQPNLTPSWVQQATGLGWALLPLYVGLQAPCVGQSGLAKLSTTGTTAAAQGLAAADDAAAQAQALGLPGGSPIWFDMEGYHPGNATCTNAVRSFVGAWVGELRARGYVPGVYGSAASTVRDVSVLGGSTPDVIWIANWNGVESVFGDPYVSDTLWPSHQRVHQYKGGHKETYGGVTIDIDSNVVDSTVVGGIAPPPPPPQPAPAGQVASGDGLAVASWPAAAFAAPAVVALAPVAQPPTNGYAVQLTATETDNQAPIDGFGAPITLHLLKPATGLTPAFSADGKTWTLLQKLPPTGLTQTQLYGYTLDQDGTAEIQTLVPGFFGLVGDTTPPSAPIVNARLAQKGLYLSWAPAQDDGTIASYDVLRNGEPVMAVPGTARRATVRRPASGAQTVYRVRATDSAGNTGQASRPVVVLAKKRPKGLPRAVPRWAFGLFAYQRHQGPRPKTAPKRPPAWYWTWAAWRAQPYRLR